MVDLVPLDELSAHASATRDFTAVIQHMTSSKRMRLDRHRGTTPSRVATYHVIHIADKTKSFFKLLCWGNALPTLRREDHDGVGDTALCVGDIVLFSKCAIRTLRGNVEARYTRHSSVQLLYRRDRYFNTREVRLKDFYPMIDWYKKHRHDFLLVEAQSNVIPGGREPMKTASNGYFTSIRDLREDVLANVKCTIQDCKRSEGEEGRTVHEQNSSDYDGAQLCEMAMKDESGDTMVLNLWDQYADPRFTACLVAHRGPIVVMGVIISRNSVTSQLLANTTPRTEFCFGTAGLFDCGADDSGHPQRIATANIATLESMSRREGSIVLENVAVEHVLLGRFVGKANHVEPTFSPLLVECVCSVCDQALPVIQTNTIPELYGSCMSRCRVKHGGGERKWRYRQVQMVLYDSQQDRLTVTVADNVLTQLLGNINSDQLIQPRGPGDPFDPHEMVSRLMNAITRGNSSFDNQLYRVELKRVPDRHQPQLNDSLYHEADDPLKHKEMFAVVAMVPITEYLW